MRTLRTATAVGLCTSSVLLAHEIAYRIAVTDPEARSELLHATGHGWFALAPVLVALSFGGFALAVANAHRPARARRLLAPAAAVAYVLVEFVERLAHGVHHHGSVEIVHVPTLSIGGLLAAGLAVAASLLLTESTDRLASLVYRPVRMLPSPPAGAVQNSAAPPRLVPATVAGRERNRAPPMSAPWH